MPKFRVISGKHRIEDKKYGPGDVVTLDKLPAAVKDQFEKVEEEPAPPAPQAPPAKPSAK